MGIDIHCRRKELYQVNNFIFMKTIKLALSTLAIISMAAAAQAQVIITIDNYSFENATGFWNENVAPSSWQYTGSNITNGGSFFTEVNVIGSTFTGGDGLNMLKLNADAGTGGTGSAWVGTNSLGTYAANTIYTLKVAVAVELQDPTFNSIIALGTDGANPGSALASTTTNFGSVSTTAFQDITLTLDTSVVTGAIGQNIVVLLENNLMAGAAFGRPVYYDNVRLEFLAVPEPATWALLAFSLTPVVIFLRRRRRG